MGDDGRCQWCSRVMVLAGMSGVRICLHCDDGHCARPCLIHPNCQRDGCASCSEMKHVFDVFPELMKGPG